MKLMDMGAYGKESENVVAILDYKDPGADPGHDPNVPPHAMMIHP